MRDWEEAEQSYKATAERYRNPGDVWYSYCKRSGRGELHEARNVALAYTDIEGVAEPFWKAVIFMLEKQPKKAISALQSSTYPWDKLLLFTIADESNDYVTRDAAMQAFSEIGNNEQKGGEKSAAQGNDCRGRDDCRGPGQQAKQNRPQGRGNAD